MRRVRVFPAGVEHAAIIEHSGAPVLVLVEAQLAHTGAVGIHFADVGHLVAAANARHAVEGQARGEEDFAVGKITGVIVVHVGFFAEGHLAQAAAVGLDLPHLPALMFAGHRKQHLVAAEIQLEVADKPRLLGLQQGG